MIFILCIISILHFDKSIITLFSSYNSIFVNPISIDLLYHVSCNINSKYFLVICGGCGGFGGDKNELIFVSTSPSANNDNNSFCLFKSNFTILRSRFFVFGSLSSISIIINI